MVKKTMAKYYPVMIKLDCQIAKDLEIIAKEIGLSTEDLIKQTVNCTMKQHFDNIELWIERFAIAKRALA